MAESRNRLVHLVPLAAVQIVGVLCGLIGVRWSSTVVPPEAMGLYGLLLSAQQVATWVTHQGLLKHVQQYWTRSVPAKPYWSLFLHASLQPALWLAGALGIVTIYITWSAGLAHPFAWWLWLVAVNLLAVVSAAAQFAVQAEERYWANFVTSTIGSVTRSFLPPLLVMAGGAALPMLGGGFLLHAVIFAAATAWCLRAARGRSESGDQPIPPPHSMVLPFMSVGLFAWLGGAAPRWLAARAFDAETLGYFILASNLALIVPAAASVIGQNYSSPALFRAARAGADDAELWRITHRTLAVVVPGAQAGLLLLAWCAPWFVGIIIDARYEPAFDWVVAAGGGILGTLSTPFFCNLLIARDRQRQCAWLSASSTVFRIAVLVTLVMCRRPEWLRLGLSVLPWPTLALEYWLTRRMLRTHRDP